MSLHLLKMCVGIETVDGLRAAQAARLEQRQARGEPAELRHLTRHMPRRLDEVVAGGSIYWVIKGFVRVRQRIARIDALETAIGGKRCALIFQPELVRTELQARRPHQGWRYLEPRDAPADLRGGAGTDQDLPPEMAAELRALGLL